MNCARSLWALSHRLLNRGIRGLQNQKVDHSLSVNAVLLWCEWGMCVQGVEWERCSVSLCVWVSELCLWAEPLQTMNFIVYISSCSWVCPRTVCLQGTGTKTQDPHCEPPLHLPAVSSPQVWALQLLSTLRHLQKLIHEIHEYTQSQCCTRQKQ